MCNFTSLFRKNTTIILKNVNIPSATYIPINYVLTLIFESLNEPNYPAPINSIIVTELYTRNQKTRMQRKHP